MRKKMSAWDRGYPGALEEERTSDGQPLRVSRYGSLPGVAALDAKVHSGSQELPPPRPRHPEGETGEAIGEP